MYCLDNRVVSTEKVKVHVFTRFEIYRRYRQILKRLEEHRDFKGKQFEVSIQEYHILRRCLGFV